MTLKPLHIIAVGRLRTPFWRDAATHYMARITRWRTVTETIIKDGPAALPPAERSALECKGIVAALGPALVPICLDEKGKCLTSRQFAAFLQELSENANRIPCFIVGGAFGLDDTVREASRHMLAFGPLTLPHELARVVLFEQLYRAEALLRNLPYHH